MDSKQLVNDIVNKRFSKARDTIREELADRIIANVESMVPEVAPEVIHEKLGIVKGVLGAIGAKSLIGKGLKKKDKNEFRESLSRYCLSIPDAENVLKRMDKMDQEVKKQNKKEKAAEAKD